MNPNSLFGISSIICLSLPIIAIILFRLYRHASLIALGFYYLLTILRCLSADTIPPVPNFQNPLDAVYSYIEIPLLLSALLFFCPSRQRQQAMHKLIRYFIVFEVMVSLYYKFSATATMYIMAPGLLLVVIYAAFLFLRQVKFTILHQKNIGRVLMLAAILFSYTCYLFVFYVYYMLKQTNIAGIYTVYFVSSTVASVLMSIGLYLMRYRIKELQELKVVRKELQMVFGAA